MKKKQIWESLVRYFLKENLPFLQHLILFEKPFIIIDERKPSAQPPDWTRWFSLLAPHRRVEQTNCPVPEVLETIEKRIGGEQNSAKKRKTIFVLLADSRVVPYLERLFQLPRWVAVVPPLSPMMDIYTFDSLDPQWVPYDDPLLLVESGIVNRAIEKRSDEAWRKEILKYLELAENLRTLLNKNYNTPDEKILKTKPFKKHRVTCPELDFIKNLLKTLNPNQRFKVEPLDEKEIENLIRHAKKELGKGILNFEDLREPIAKKLMNWLTMEALPRYEQYRLLGLEQLQELSIVTTIQMVKKDRGREGEKWYEQQKEIVGLGKTQTRKKRNKTKRRLLPFP